MEKKRIAVIFGGVSSEHEISLVSAATVIGGLNPDKYEVYPIGITKSGVFRYFPGNPAKISAGKWEDGETLPCILSPDRIHHGLLLQRGHGWENIRIDCVFPVLHGKNGEDGTIQGLMTLAGIPFVGCGVLASAACMDKETTHILCESAGIRMASSLCVTKDRISDTIASQVKQKLGYPVFVKPANAGSSVGVSKVKAEDELLSAIEAALEHDRKAIIEESICGTEVECAVLGNSDARSSVPGSIRPASEFYDYAAKYQSGDSELSIPAPFDDSVLESVKQIAEEAFRVMGCSGLARVDFFVTEAKTVILNEVNTLPGFTGISMYPKLWEHMGVPISDLLDRLIEYAMQE